MALSDDDIRRRKEIGLRLRAQRESIGLSQEQLASFFGKGQPFIKRLETGEGEIKAEYAPTLQKAGINVHLLYGKFMESMKQQESILKVYETEKKEWVRIIDLQAQRIADLERKLSRIKNEKE